MRKDKNKQKIFDKLRMADKIKGEDFYLNLMFNKHKNNFILELNTKSLLALKRYVQFKDIDAKLKERVKSNIEFSLDKTNDNSQDLGKFSDILFDLIYAFTRD